MSILFICGILCMLLGIAFIAGTFLVQKKEDAARMPGYYTEGLILANEAAGKDTRRVTFQFTKDFRLLECSGNYPQAEAQTWVRGRKYLIVYDEKADKVYCNPMKEYRKKQNIMIVAGGALLLLGINISMVACGFIMG